MKKRDYLAFFVFELIIILGICVFQKAPGYMDAEYYFSGGQRLVAGYGFSENFLWNYLDDPKGLPHPSHGYWMPLVSILSAFGMAVVNNSSFEGGRILFVILAALVPPITAALSYQINQRRDFAVLSGLFAAIPPFYLSYLGTTDSFALLMVLGGLFFYICGIKPIDQGNWQDWLLFTGLGLLAGLIHLTRVDGMLWIGIAFFYILLVGYKQRAEQNISRIIINILSRLSMSIAGYLLVMGPWMARNYAVFGSLLSPGGMKSFWITSYDELYAYPASILTWQHWLGSGIGEILKARSWAGWINIQSTVVVEGEIFLTPLIIWGLWKKRELLQVKVAILAWLGIFVIMTFVFPFQGARGGFFHSSSPLQPFFWAMAPEGLEGFISWGKRVRRWNYSQANNVFKIGMIVLICFMSVAIVAKRVIGGNFSQPGWNNGYQYYVQVEEKIFQAGVKPGDIVMVNNPPGFYLASTHPCIVIPDGGIETLIQAAHRYGAKYLILEANHPAGLQNLFDNPGNQAGLRFLFSFQGAQIYQIGDS